MDTKKKDKNPFSSSSSFPPTPSSRTVRPPPNTKTHKTPSPTSARPPAPHNISTPPASAPCPTHPPKTSPDRQKHRTRHSTRHPRHRRGESTRLPFRPSPMQTGRRHRGCGPVQSGGGEGGGQIRGWKIGSCSTSQGISSLKCSISMFLSFCFECDDLHNLFHGPNCHIVASSTH